MGTTLHQQELLARTCLSHTGLCGRDELSDEIVHDNGLRVNRFSVFAKKDMCAPVVHRSSTTQVAEPPLVQTTTTTTKAKETTTSSIPSVSGVEHLSPENPSAIGDE